MMLAATMGIAVPARAQWKTVCIHHTGRFMTCSTTYTPAPTPARTPRPAASPSVAWLLAAELLEEDEAVLGTWRAAGVAFESHGHRTLLEVRVTAARGGIHLDVPAVLGLPGGTAYDLARVAPKVYRATDRAGRITTFRVVGERAELIVTGADGTGLVTFQFDEHEVPR